MKQFSTHDLLWVLKSSNKRLCVLMSTQEHSREWLYGAMSTHECWWALIASWWCHAHDCTCAPMSAHCSMAPSSWVHGCSWVLMGARAHECSWLLISSTHEKPWTWSHGAMSTHESKRAIMSKGLWVLISTIAPYSWVLLGTHDHTWVLMGAHECSQQVMSTELFHRTINKKC